MPFYLPPCATRSTLPHTVSIHRFTTQRAQQLRQWLGPQAPPLRNAPRHASRCVVARRSSGVATCTSGPTTRRRLTWHA
eukprot:6254982-Lingulodinium_polyedra.AAC.1